MYHLLKYKVFLINSYFVTLFPLPFEVSLISIIYFAFSFVIISLCCNIYTRILQSLRVDLNIISEIAPNLIAHFLKYDKKILQSFPCCICEIEWNIVGMILEATLSCAYLFLASVSSILTLQSYSVRSVFILPISHHVHVSTVIIVYVMYFCSFQSFDTRYFLAEEDVLILKMCAPLT